MNLLAFKVNQLGDNIVFVSVIQQLRRTFPEARLTLFTSPEAAPLYGGPLGPTRLIIAKRTAFNSSWRNPVTFLHYWWKARSARARAVLLSGDQGSVAHLLGILTVPPVRVGSAEVNIRVPTGLTHVVRCPPGSKIAEWNWEMGRAFAVALGRYDWPLKISPPDLSHLIAPRPKTRPRVIVHGGASLPYRRWPLENFGSLADKLSIDFEVIWIQRPDTGSPSLRPEVARVTCETLADLASLLASADLLIGNHSGPFQLAAALGCPSVVLSGPTHPEWDPAWHESRFLILRTPGLACLPCEKHVYAPERCLNPTEPMACLRRWSVDSVEKKCREWLERDHRRNGQA